MRDSYLAEKRKQAGLTQREFGMHLGMQPSYAARRISQLEAGYGKLTPEQLTKARDIFASRKVDVSVEELERNLADGGTNIIDLTERLATADKPVLMCLCYSGDTRMSADPRVVANMRTALNKNLACALFVPIPPPPYERTLKLWYMEGYWSSVWRSAFTLSREFANVSLYSPNPEIRLPAAMPPFQSRFFLLLEPVDHGEYETALYLMLETQDAKQMELIATKEGRGPYQMVADWEEYFGGVLQHWKSTQQLPGDDSYWKYWEGEELLNRRVTPGSSFPVLDDDQAQRSHNEQAPA